MEYNQLRVNVRNYCVGLTCEEIEKQLACEQHELNNLQRRTRIIVERVNYFQEYLAELRAEQNAK